MGVLFSLHKIMAAPHTRIPAPMQANHREKKESFIKHSDNIMIILSQKKIKHSIVIKILHGILKRKSVIKEVINQEISITTKDFKKHGLWGRTMQFVEIFVYLHLKQNPGLSNTKGTHSLFEPITQMVDIV